MKVTKVVTLNSVEINQVILDFASLVNNLRNLIKRGNDINPVDLETYLYPLEINPKNGNKNITNNIFEVISNDTNEVVIKVED